jgi:hypothetical protein
MSNAVLASDVWAEKMFGGCDLGDKRLTNRVVKVSGQLANYIGESLAHSSQGNQADLTGAYRLIRNPKVSAEAIAQAGYEAIVKDCEEIDELLAIEDTTSMSFTHSVAQHLGNIGGPKAAKTRGFHVHSSLLLNANNGKTVGLIHQQIWSRELDTSSTENKQQPAEKESLKWQKASEAIRQRLGSTLMPRIISVCDREADIYDYLCDKIVHQERFIVRASHNRKLSEEEVHDKLFDMKHQGESLGEYQVKVEQKSGRKARTVSVELRSLTVVLPPPTDKRGQTLPALTVNVVFATEKNSNNKEGALCWVIYTTEPVTTFSQARKVIRCYEQRWRIEEFHKAWKTGAGAERQRMQTPDNLEKMLVLLGFVAVRLLQLREAFEEEQLHPNAQKIPCTTLLSKTEWHILWRSIEKRKKLPSQPPSLGWVYQAIAKLGGWANTKRTGKACWSTIWKGWFRLSERVEGHELMKSPEM